MDAAPGRRWDVIYVLSMWVCLVAHPDRCQRQALEVQSCNAAGIGQMATWALKHPEWRVERWNCRAGEEE